MIHLFELPILVFVSILVLFFVLFWVLFLFGGVFCFFETEFHYIAHTDLELLSAPISGALEFFICVHITSDCG